MTDKIVVDAVENHFIPLLIHNNSKGYDRKILQQFKEPAWNYQVVRFLTKNTKDIIPRKDKVWTKLALLQRMKLTLEKQNKTVPTYLEFAIQEADVTNHKSVAIAQYCYWTGEAKLGQIDGVIRTEAGWFNRREVTKLTYDSSKLSIAQLLAEAKKLKCADAAFIANTADLATAKKSNILLTGALNTSYKAAKASDQKKQINKLSLPNTLTLGQKTKFNAYYHKNLKKALSYLTESQRAEYKAALK